MIGEHAINENSLFIELKEDKITIGYKNKVFDYNLHFHFGINNKSKDEKVFNIYIGCKNTNGLNNKVPRLWISDDINKEYRLITAINGKTNYIAKYYLKMELKAGEKKYIANFPPIRYSKLISRFKQLANMSNAKVRSIGKTVEKRSINAYEFGDMGEKTTILFVSGFHPPERDTLAIEAIMERFTNKVWKKKVLEKYSFSLIPILNPDGFANAMQGSNINEINFHWKFFGNSFDECPEAYYIWEYCTKIKPIVFFDFHAFTFQNWNARPYDIPEEYYIEPKARKAQRDLNKQLIELCNGVSGGRDEHILALTLLHTKLRKEIGTITAPKFHLHMKEGIKESKRKALRSLDIVLEILQKYNIYSTNDILIKPFGKVKPSVFDRIRIRSIDLWYIHLKPILRFVYGPLKH